MAAELATKNPSVAFANVPEKWQKQVEAGKAATSQSEKTFAKVSDETSAEVCKLRSKRDNTAARHHKLLASIRRVVMPRKERNDKVSHALLMLHKIYGDGHMFTVETHVAEWGDF